MRAIRSLIGLVLGLTIFGAIASAIAAAMARSRLVSEGGEEDDEFDLVAIFNGLEFASRARSFRRGSVLTWYGGATVDLTGATLDPGGATLELRAAFGGLQLIVPAGWRVESHLIGIMGGAGEMRDPGLAGADSPVLTVSGFAVFGGVGIESDRIGTTARWNEPSPSNEPVLEQAAEAGAGG